MNKKPLIAAAMALAATVPATCTRWPDGEDLNELYL